MIWFLPFERLLLSFDKLGDQSVYRVSGREPAYRHSGKQARACDSDIARQMHGTSKLLKRPKLLDLIAPNYLSATKNIDGVGREVASLSQDGVARCTMALPLRGLVPARWRFHRLSPVVIGHVASLQIRVSKLSSIFRNWLMPNHRNMAVTQELSMTGQEKLAPENAPSKPIETPTMGLSE